MTRVGPTGQCKCCNDYHGGRDCWRAAGPYVCTCKTPNPHPIGECLDCGRLIPSMAHIR